MSPLDPFLGSPRIAYFSMEIALQPEIATYSGGLGVLAGDTVRSSADLELPLVAVTLVSRAGYFRQEIDAQGRQVEHLDPWDPSDFAQSLAAKIALPIGGRPVWVQAWLYVMTGASGYAIPVLLLDTDLDENHPEDRTITHFLYGGDEAYRLKQEIVLGVGGARLLQALGFQVHTYHLNEGHSALLAVELLKRFERPRRDVGRAESRYDVNRVKDLCVFTTHTPVEAGHDQFSYELVQQLLADFVELNELKILAGPDRLNMTRLALNLSAYVNGVAKRHAETSNRLFPGYRVYAVNNGVHPKTWTSPSFARLYQANLADWQHEPEILVRADQIPDEEIWQAHQEAKRTLIATVQAAGGVAMDPEVPIIGFARRMTGYKRPDLLFSDPARLEAICQRYPFQVVLAGKAHPRDENGKQLIELIHGVIGRLAGTVKIAFLSNYGMAQALYLTSGSDIWLNTPLPPLEASGTSGMKAAFNGVLNLSTLDGWWVEGCIEGVTGWAIGDDYRPEARRVDALALYDKLEQVALPLYYNDRSGWIRMMKGSISKLAYYFNSHRMMRRYAAEAYLR